ncbi:MAG: sterol-binding protein [Burkholderiales bacterium]|nr:sterol-binding protein [Burkholderiales bacterium]
MLNRPFVLVVNHLLAAESWARNSLLPHAGKSARLSVPPFDFDLKVLPDGLVEESTDAPETRIKASPLALARAAAGEIPEVELSGDIEFAKALNLLFNHLRWDFEEDLGKFTGDVVAHRIAQAASSFVSWQKEACRNLAENLVEYWTEERPILAGRLDILHYIDEVDRIRDDLERLEKRMERLENA